MDNHKKRSTFSGKLGYVPSAAGASWWSWKYLEVSLSCGKNMAEEFFCFIYIPVGPLLRLYIDNC